MCPEKKYRVKEASVFVLPVELPHTLVVVKYANAETQTFWLVIEESVHGSLGSSKMEYATLGPLVAM